MYLFDNNFNKATQKLFTRVLSKIPANITPSHITWSGFLIAFFTLIYLSFVNINLTWFLIFAFITLIFDLFDGMLARFRKVTSFKGKVEDAVADGLVNIIFIIGLTQFFNFSAVFVYILIWSYIAKIILVLLKKDREIGGGRASFLIAILIFNWNSLGWGFENLLCLFVIWNILSIISGLLNSKINSL